MAALIAVGFIPDIKFDFSQWALGEGLSRNAFDRIVFDCLKERSLLYTIVVAGLGDGYTNLKFPFGYISYIRPTIRTIGNVRFGSLADISSELAMSALPLKADMLSVEIDARFVPNADIQVCNIFATVEPRNRDVDHFLLGGPASTEKDFTQPKIKKCHLVADHDQPCSL